MHELCASSSICVNKLFVTSFLTLFMTFDITVLKGLHLSFIILVLNYNAGRPLSLTFTYTFEIFSNQSIYYNIMSVSQVPGVLEFFSIQRRPEIAHWLLLKLLFCTNFVLLLLEFSNGNCRLLVNWRKQSDITTNGQKSSKTARNCWKTYICPLLCTWLRCCPQLF